MVGEERDVSQYRRRSLSQHMRPEQIEELQSNELLRKRLAKAMAVQCFRNTKLEDFHAGTFPSSQTGDYSDVKVVSPFGEIPWNRVSRISDEEMKALMLDVVERCDRMLSTLLSDPEGSRLVEELKVKDAVPEWSDL